MRKKIIDFWEMQKEKTAHIDDGAAFLALQGARMIETFFNTVYELIEEGVLMKTEKEGVYMLKSNNIKEGIYKGYRKTYGFVLGEDGEEDTYIAEENRNGAMHNDKVSVRLFKRPLHAKKQEGEVINILERANTMVIGTYERQQHYGFVVPDDERIGTDVYIPLDQSLNARSGAKVLVKITVWPDKQHSAEGIIQEILGYEGDVGLDINCIMTNHQLPFSFPQEVLVAANQLSPKVSPEGKRVDLRKIDMITIDGEDAKDLDDAVSITLMDNGHFELGVHIADVSHYVESGGIIDREAYQRGTSVYLVDRVIPMLPPVLSNGLCSLNAGEDRYAMSCIMEIDENGSVVRYRICPSVICVNRRCSYREVYKALEEDIIPEDLVRYMGLLKNLKSVSIILNAMRVRRGALDFEFPEYKVLIDKRGTPLQVVKRERTIAEKMIEEAMLIANETVATHLKETDKPSIYRIHELPKEEKLATLQTVINYLGAQTIFGEEVTPKELQAFLTSVKGKDIEKVAQMMTLRSMQQARYSTTNAGHFGLASSCYTHFTSPIRRYPDLIVHRLLKKDLSWIGGYRKKDGEEEYLVQAAEHSSIREQIAVKAERETTDLKKTQYMQPFVGQVFKAVVSSITSFGLFVEIDNGIDGLVHINTMDDDSYFFSEEQFLLVGRRTGNVYHLGQEVTVTLAKVDIERRAIDFVLGEFSSLDSLAKKHSRIGTYKKSLKNKKEDNSHKKKNKPKVHKKGKDRKHATKKQKGRNKKKMRR